MNTAFITPVKQLLSDRKFALVIGVIVALTLAFCLMMILSVQPRDIQVVNRYTDFGEAHYYRDRWYYLYSFAVMAIVMTITHILLIAKIHSLGRRVEAFLIGGLTVLLYIVAFAYAHQVIITAFL